MANVQKPFFFFISRGCKSFFAISPGAKDLPTSQFGWRKKITNRKLIHDVEVKTYLGAVKLAQDNSTFDRALRDRVSVAYRARKKKGLACTRPPRQESPQPLWWSASGAKILEACVK